MWLYSNRSSIPPDPLEGFRENIRNRGWDATLLAPTATLAEHIRHRIAREGFLLRAEGVLTLARFLDPLAAEYPQATAAQVNWAVRQVLETNSIRAFEGLAASSGLRRILASLAEELSAAGATEALLWEACDTPISAAAAEAVLAVWRMLRGQGLFLRTDRCRAAAERLRQRGTKGKSYFLTGFSSFVPAELELLSALSEGSVSLSLPDSWAAPEVRGRLERMGFRGIEVTEKAPACSYVFMRASGAQAEAEEIARRITMLAGAGRRFREIGVVMRREQPYAAILETAFRRFGIPARLYFRKPLERRPLPRYLLKWIQSAEQGWGYASLRELLASPYSGLGGTADGDRLDHWLQGRQPDSGLPEIDAGECYEQWKRRAAKLHNLLSERLPPERWARELAVLAEWAVLSEPNDSASAQQVLAWRETGAAWTAWSDSLQQAAGLLPGTVQIPLSRFRQALEEILAHTDLPNPCQRRDAVHVMDAYEARLWSLPVIFVCGLAETRFPEYHSEHPLLGDRQREVLRQSGVLLRTAADRQREEEMLLQTAIGRASETCLLSCPERDAEGEETLPSLLLTRLLEGKSAVLEAASCCRPRPRFEKAAYTRPGITQGNLVDWLQTQTSVLTPTAVESFLQCPFQFFSRYALRISSGPRPPGDRLDSLLKGDILHKILAEAESSAQPVGDIFARQFASACRKARVPAGWRTERIRLELEANLRVLLESPPLAGARTIAVERSFEIPLSAGLTLRGQMDRVAEVPDRGLVVIDYKYSTPRQIRERVRSQERGDLVQGGLYLLAATRLLGLPAAGMLYCGLRGELSWNGWHLPIFGWQETGESVDAQELEKHLEQAVEITVRMAGDAGSGRIAPQPASRAKCVWCDYRDLCRIEISEAHEKVRAGGSAL